MHIIYPERENKQHHPKAHLILNSKIQSVRQESPLNLLAFEMQNKTQSNVYNQSKRLTRRVQREGNMNMKKAEFLHGKSLQCP